MIKQDGRQLDHQSLEVPRTMTVRRVEGRVVLTADAAAIAAVSESDPHLVTLEAGGLALLETREYDEHGNLMEVAVQDGTEGEAVKRQSFTYEEQVVPGLASIWVVSSQTVYRDDAGTEADTTEFGYQWHGDGSGETWQMSQRTTILPAVTPAENGNGVNGEIIEQFDERGFLTSRMNELGTTTLFAYDQLRGALIQRTDDDGGLNLITSFQVDDLGRTVLEKGPLHWGNDQYTSPSFQMRSAKWTYYKDREDEVWQFGGFIAAETEPVAELVGPVTILKHNAAPPDDAGYAGWRQEARIDAIYPYPGEGIPQPETDFSQSTWVRWTARLFDKGGELKEERLYWDIPASAGDFGSKSTNYGETTFGYDAAGRQCKFVSPGGTIDTTVFNARGWAEEFYVGTDDSGGGGDNMALTRHQTFDDDGNVLSATLKVVDDASTEQDRVTDYVYDWRNRRTDVLTTVEVEKGSADSWGLRTAMEYDNRDLVVGVQKFSRLLTGGSSSSAPGSWILCAQQEAFYDARNRRFRTLRYGVDPETGEVGAQLVDNTYFDLAGNVVREAPAGSRAFTVHRYDALSRLTASFVACSLEAGSSSSAPFDPDDISNAIVMEQSEFAYDQAGNRISTKTRQRFDDATGTGELGTPTSQPKARLYYAASYQDALGRIMAVANYGTNGGSAWSRDNDIPERSDDILVFSTKYDFAGNATEETDPADTVTCREYDNADRVVTLVENCQCESSSSSSSAADANRTTRYEYTDDSLLAKLLCENASTGLQVTEWEYGVSQATGSELASNRLVNRKIYPDTSGSSSSSSGPDSSRVVAYRYNTQSQVTGELDQNETEHAYDYDRLGRLLTDTATVNDAAIDDTVGILEAVWEVRGLRSRARSRAANGTILNEVHWDYNDFGQAVQEYQEHDGAVDGSTPHVGYAYADPADSETPNTIRRTAITYPNTAEITTEYAAGVADALSRPSALKQGATVLSTYKYLGLGTSIEVKYQAANNLLLTYENGGTGTAGDEYTGLDRFGRLVETIWKQGATVRVQSSYGRNRFGGVVWRRDDLAHAMSVTTEDNFYWYDGLYQVQQHQRGELNAYQTGITSPVQEEGWSYDEMGNWLAYDTQVPSLDQDRAYNKANEITSITNPSSVVQSNYDFAGNMTTMPKAGDWTTECLLKWDAWQRLVEITQGTDAPIRYTYDALTRRIITAGSEYRQYYYDDQWRAVEEQVGEEEPEVDCDYVWGVLGRWDLVRRRSGASLATSHFVLKDYLDPVAIADEEGEVLERFGYDAFGPVRFMGNNFDPTTGGESEYAWSFLFHAEFLDTDTGLYNYGYRYYHPQLGRWLSRDPIGERGGGSNLFIVVGNSPTEANDNLGLDSTPLPGQTSVEPIKTEWNEKELAKLDKSLEGGSGITLLSPTTDNTVGMVNQELLDKLQKEIDKENALKDSKGRSCYNIKILYNPATRNQFFDAVKCAHYVICTAHGDKNQNLTATGRETVEASGLHNTAKAHGHRVATIACHTTVDGNASPGTTSQLRIIGVATTWISTLKAKTDCPCPEIIRIIAGPQTQDYLFHYKTKDK